MAILRFDVSNMFVSNLKYVEIFFFDKKDTFWEKNTKNVLYFVKVATYSVTNTPYFYHLAKTSITHDLTKNDTEMITLL